MSVIAAPQLTYRVSTPIPDLMVTSSTAAFGIYIEPGVSPVKWGFQMSGDLQVEVSDAQTMPPVRRVLIESDSGLHTHLGKRAVAAPLNSRLAWNRRAT